MMDATPKDMELQKGVVERLTKEITVEEFRRRLWEEHSKKMQRIINARMYGRALKGLY